MAWSSSSKDLCSWPFLVREITVTADSATATEVAHGGPTGTPPDMYPLVLTKSNPTATEMSVTTVDGTNLTIDAEGASSCKIYCVWFAQARQDSQSIDTDNDS
jgi:hypothetical protein